MGYRINLASDLRHRGLLRKMAPAAEKDALGQYPVAETTVAAVWCAVVPQTGSLMNGRPAETVVSRTTHKIIIRWRADVTPNMWMEVYGIRYDVLYVLDPYHDRKILELFCEVKDDGSGSGVRPAGAGGAGPGPGESGGPVSGEGEGVPPEAGEQDAEPAAE